MSESSSTTPPCCSLFANISALLVTSIWLHPSVVAPPPITDGRCPHWMGGQIVDAEVHSESHCLPVTCFCLFNPSDSILPLSTQRGPWAYIRATNYGDRHILPPRSSIRLRRRNCAGCPRPEPVWRADAELWASHHVVFRLHRCGKSIR